MDKLISGLNDWRFGLIERPLVKLARLLHEGEYALNKNKNSLISVYTPTYNRANILLERAIPTVLAQTYKNFEFIIVGDCCTDDTAARVKAIKDSRIRFYNLPKRGYRYPPTAENHWLAGPVVAANQALSMVRGKWIARIDDDDLWTSDHLDSLLNFARLGNYEFVSAAYEAERYGQMAIVDVKRDNPRIGGTQTWLYRSYLKFMRYNINCWRKNWNRVNDTDLQDRFYKAGVRLGFLEKVVAYILPRPGEKNIGLSAYKESAAKLEDHFKFN
ncbi:MAG: glycosyltransferase family 2 protein [Patescibacteria group bacterium]